MATMTIRNIPDDVYRAIRVRAALNDRSAEAEVRALLLSATTANGSLDVGEALLALGQRVGLTDEEHALFERDKSLPREIELP
jgi:plasmid stability protein